jgi:hypothetical protein
MNRRHAAALALVGWYLMIPPFDGKSVNINSPLSSSLNAVAGFARP